MRNELIELKKKKIKKSVWFYKRWSNN